MMAQMAALLPLLLLVVLGGARAHCPSQESLAPHCFCVEAGDGPMMSCSHLLNAEELLGPVQASAHRDMFSLLIRNSSLLYMPDGLFRNTRYQKIRLLHTELISLSDTEQAFAGLESTLTEFRATEAPYAAQWRWHQLADLKKLNLIDVNWIDLGSISERFPALPKLTALGIIRAGLTHVLDWAFASLPALQIFDLHGNKLKELQRTVLPLPADHLFVINLSDNEFESLSVDMFQKMPSLSNVDLSANRFSVLDEKTFSWAFDNLHSLHLAGNELRCDCRMRWVVGRRFPGDLYVECHLPENLRGKTLRSLLYKDLWC